jgi:hypothetical protein
MEIGKARRLMMEVKGRFFFSVAGVFSIVGIILYIH